MNKKTKVVWITGASSGIGAELARQYSILGVKLILSSRRADILANIKSGNAAKPKPKGGVGKTKPKAPIKVKAPTKPRPKKPPMRYRPRPRPMV